ncbi:AAA family ATPase [Edaphobacillus lindanitolerans]|uniref:AAA domain-containing protein n=1 Tax=Edaphobacillus lindanitolerans TaxID=550447 RepID=A0A1U7PQ76_9BACI|nr:AAA family ATPase [Edaphobacillus lindanitolerans]SIT84477.1 AAA domain-containing protein [Edaphobacillus lindanitolerans]
MELILITGPQAVGKMTVGRELEKLRDARLLFNHATLDLFANFLGYSKEAFRLSDETRKNLFRAFVQNPGVNVTSGIILTVVVAYNQEGDHRFLQEVSDIFTSAGGDVFIIELEADLSTRLERNVMEDRLAAKPSKRDLEFSRNELLRSLDKHRLQSLPGEVERTVPAAGYLRLDNSGISACEAATAIHQFIEDRKNSRP